MKSLFIRILSSLLAAGMVSFAAPASVLFTDIAPVKNLSAAVSMAATTENVTVDGINYVIDLDAKTAMVGDNSGFTGSTVIPAEITGSDGTVYAVTAIGDYAFKQSSGLKSIKLPDGLKSIGSWVFWGCLGLESANIPDSVTSIGESAFRDCKKLVSISIPSDVTSIGNNAFMDCQILTSPITIPKGVNEIPEGAFWGCSKVPKITLHDDVTSIGDFAFDNCNTLENITIPKSVTSIGKNAFAHCNNFTEIVIPKGVTSLEERAFWDCKSLETITIPYNLNSLGYNVFIGVPLKNITLTPGADKNTPLCFAYNSTIEKVVLADGITEIGDNTFKNCYSLKSVEIPEGVTSIGDNTFEYCLELTNIKIPDSVTSIGMGAFYHCSKLTGIEIPDSVTSIGGEAFFGCSNLTSITIPKNITSIEPSTFAHSGLRTVEFAEGSELTTIGDYAFASCIELNAKITIPEKVNYIGYEAFAGDQHGEPTFIFKPLKAPTIIGSGGIPFYRGAVVSVPEGTPYEVSGYHSGSWARLLSHDTTLEFKERTEATCTEDGFIEHYQCSCGMMFTDPEGTTELTLEDAIHTPAKGHSYTVKPSEKVAIEADCDHPAAHYVQCNDCDEVSDTLTVLVGKALGHSYTEKASDKIATPADCTHPATYYVQCDRCNEINDTLTVTVGKALGHTGGKATCHSLAVCDRCKERYGEIDKSNHDGETELRNAVKATCTKDGYTGDTYCKECGTKIGIGKTIAATGHTFDKWVTVKKPTNAKAGLKQRTCKDCGFVEKKKINELKHKHQFSTELKYDNSVHWQECDCGEVDNVAAHIYDNDQDATCNICGYEREIKAPVVTAPVKPEKPDKPENETEETVKPQLENNEIMDDIANTADEIIEEIKTLANNQNFLLTAIAVLLFFIALLLIPKRRKKTEAEAK